MPTDSQACACSLSRRSPYASIWKACIDKCVPGARKVWLKDRKSDFERGVI